MAYLCALLVHACFTWMRQSRMCDFKQLNVDFCLDKYRNWSSVHTHTFVLTTLMVCEREAAVGSRWVCEAGLLLQSVTWKAGIDGRSPWREGVRGRRRGRVGQAENGPFTVPAPHSKPQSRAHALSTRSWISLATPLQSQEVCVENVQGHQVKSAWSR